LVPVKVRAFLALFFVSAGALAQPAKLITVDLGRGVNVQMVLVPKGEETHGSPETEKGRDEDEREHEVVLSSDYYMGRYPITRRQFGAFAVETHYRTEAEAGASGGAGWDGKELVQRKEFTWRSPGFGQSEDDPVTLVTFADAEAFAGWFSKKSRRTVTLPTEAQWEHAARAGTKTAYYDGDGEEAALAIGWFKKNAGDGTHPVGTKKPNAFGLYDMGGNVFEWCRDWYALYPTGKLVDPIMAEPHGDTPRRVLRGGSWLKDGRWGRSAARYKNTPGSRNADNGFRVVASVEATLPAPSATAASVPPPPPTYTPPPPPAPPAAEPSSVNPFFLLFGGGALAALLYFLLRKKKPASPIDDGPPTVRTGEDGFWIEGDLPAGTRAKYTCTVHGVEVTDTVAIVGGRTFVYTGGVPEGVRVLEVTRVHADRPMASPAYRGQGPEVRRVVARDSEPPPPPVTPFGGFPPAY
jgi:formylglycine-generating enzyme required for sulfatase activity